MNILDMKQKRMTLVTGMRQMLDKFDGVEMTAEGKAIYDKMEKDFDALNKSIETMERQQERERRLGETERRGAENKDGERMKAFARALSGDIGEIAQYKNSYTLGTDATAGYLTAPVEFVQELIKGLDDAVFMRRIAHMTPRIGAAQSLGYPYRKTEAADAEWSTETAEATEETTLDYGRREFKPNRMNKLLKVSRLLMQHAPMANGTLLEEMRYRIAITQEKAYMTGNGTGKPLGIFTASASGISTARDVETSTAATVKMDDFIDAKYKVKGQYHARASWVMHRDLVKAAAKFKDTSGQYLWQPSTQMGQPDRMLGNPVYMSEYAPNDYTGGKYAAVYGDFGYYWICDADPLEVQVLKELYATAGQIGYLFNYYGDGAPVVDEAFARIKIKAS